MTTSAPVFPFAPPARVLLITSLKDLDDTLPFTIAYAAVPEVQVEILHVIPASRLVESTSPDQRASIAAAGSHAARILEDAVYVARSSGLVCGSNLQRGELPRLLGRAIENYWPDRIIVGSCAHNELDPAGSVVDFVLRESVVPVYVVRRPHRRPMSLPPDHEIKILFATSLDREALHVAEYVLQCAKSFNAALTMLHVIDAPPNSGSCGMRVRDYADRHFQKLQSQLPDARIPCRVEEGPVVETVCRIADEEAFDLLLIGSVSGASFREDIMPGNASRIVRHAPCSVLVLKRPEGG